MKKAMISPSMMCADFSDLKNEIAKLEKADVEYLHIDVMDGHFVPNFTLGPDYVNALRKITDLPMDMHLMIENPENYIKSFNPQKNDIVCIHQESTIHLQRAIQIIKDCEAIPGIALNPATPLESIKYLLDDVKMILIMTVNPGFAGQKLVPQTLRKIADTKQLITDNNLDILIEVDGNVSLENAVKMRKAGADIFVAGSSGLFLKDTDILDAAKLFRKAIS